MNIEEIRKLRAIEMLRIAAKYIRDYYPDGIIHYDEAECDGYCVADDCESAADGLADQERVERHVTKRVARECYQIACGCEFGYTAAKTIREKYEVP